MMQTFMTINFFIFIATLPIFFILVGVSGSTLGKHFDHVFSMQRIKLPFTFKFFFSEQCIRGTMYAWFLFWNGNPADKLYAKFPNLFKYILPLGPTPWSNVDYRPNARKRDWFVAGLIWVNSFTFCITAIILCATVHCLPAH